MGIVLRPYQSKDFTALHDLDRSCFAPGIAYSKTTLRWFLALRSADCVVAVDKAHIAGYILAEQSVPLAHIVTLDVAMEQRKRGVGSILLMHMEEKLRLRGVQQVLLETAIDNQAAVAFWQRRGYRIEAILKRYYLGRLDAYEMSKLLAAPAKKRAGRTAKTTPKEL